MSERRFSLYDVEQFLREAGAERVTEDAVLDLERELEKLAEKIAANALRYAKHAGRNKLIRGSDILLTGSSADAYNTPRNLRRKARMTKRASIAEM